MPRYLVGNLIAAGVIAVGIFALGWATVVKYEYAWNWAKALRFLVRIDAETGDWSPGLLMDGFFMTIRLTLWGGVLCLLLGLVIGLLRVSRLTGLRWLGTAYVELIRNTPPLVFMFIMYFFVSSQVLPPDLIKQISSFIGDYPSLEVLFGRANLVENFASGTLCIALYEAAYVAEIVRGGIQSIPNSQWDASEALGMRRWQTMQKIILPQALRKIAPQTTNQLISLVKDSSIISVISVQELTYVGIEVATTTGRLFETLLIIAAMYFLLCWPISLLLREAELKTQSF